MCPTHRQPKWSYVWTTSPSVESDSQRVVRVSRDAALRLRRLRRLRRMLVKEQISVERYLQEQDALLGNEPGQRDD